MITMTETAKKKFLDVVASEGRQGQGLRVAVQKGGTLQPEFALNFVGSDEVREDDTVVDLGEFRIYVDPESAKWLEGASIDFVDTLHESGFKVDAPKSGIPAPHGPVAAAVQEVLEQKINPAVASHGGRVSLVAIDQGTAYLRFGGGCQGCGQITVTLKHGVEKMLLEMVPQISKVVDVTDHAAGENPYYEPGA